ncbi:hypothetical protein LIER_24422 [Lithospermum erythrorhizon]|uniref:Uncharacterized protein n=1 Tax=Lithospermum erythrorhizon TaxID=34254 RepID=A0AAV3R2I4_LITER
MTTTHLPLPLFLFSITLPPFILSLLQQNIPNFFFSSREEGNNFEPINCTKMNLNNNQYLPLSQQQNANQEQSSTIRRRLSSVSLKSMSEYSSPATTWALRRSKSVSALGENAGNSIAKWWESGWDWILSKKPAFAIDIEMSEEEKEALGGQNKGSWRHVLYKLSSEIKKMVGSGAEKAKFAEKYDSVSNYFKNFDHRRDTLPQ